MSMSTEECPCCGAAMPWSNVDEKPTRSDWCGFCREVLMRLSKFDDIEARAFRAMLLSHETDHEIREASLALRAQRTSCNHTPDAVFYQPCPKCGRSTDWSGG